jgi:chromosome segregation ATPase
MSIYDWPPTTKDFPEELEYLSRDVESEVDKVEKHLDGLNEICNSLNDNLQNDILEPAELKGLAVELRLEVERLGEVQFSLFNLAYTLRQSVDAAMEVSEANTEIIENLVEEVESVRDEMEEAENHYETRIADYEAKIEELEVDE